MVIVFLTILFPILSITSIYIDPIETDISPSKSNMIARNSYQESIIIKGDIDFLQKAQMYNWKGNGTNSDPFIIEDLLFRFNEFGFAVYDSQIPFVLRNCTFLGNTVNTSHCAILLFNVINAMFINNSLLNIGDGFEIIYSSQLTIEHNLVNNSKLSSIWFTSVHNSSINHNLVTFSRASGIYLVDSYNNSISANTVRNSSSNGLWIHNSSNSIISNNIFNSNGYNGLCIEAESKNNVILDNIIKRNSQSGIFLGKKTEFNCINCNNISFNAIPITDKGNNNIFADNILEYSFKSTSYYFPLFLFLFYFIKCIKYRKTKYYDLSQ